MLDEIHFTANGSLANDEVIGLEHLKLQLCEHCCYEVWVSVSEERHVSDQATAVEANNFLWTSRHYMVVKACKMQQQKLTLTYHNNAGVLNIT